MCVCIFIYIYIYIYGSITLNGFYVLYETSRLPRKNKIHIDTPIYTHVYGIVGHYRHFAKPSVLFLPAPSCKKHRWFLQSRPSCKKHRCFLQSLPSCQKHRCFLQSRPSCKKHRCFLQSISATKDRFCFLWKSN